MIKIKRRGSNIFEVHIEDYIEVYKVDYVNYKWGKTWLLEQIEPFNINYMKKLYMHTSHSCRVNFKTLIEYLYEL